MRASAALYEPLRSDPQMVSTFNVSVITKPLAALRLSRPSRRGGPRGPVYLAFAWIGWRAPTSYCVASFPLGDSRLLPHRRPFRDLVDDVLVQLLQRRGAR